MLAATSEKNSHEAAPQTCRKDTTRPGPTVKRRGLPPLGSEPAAPVAGWTPVLRNRPVSVLELPPLIAQVGPGRAIGGTKWTEVPGLMASALGTSIPIRAAAEASAQSLTEKDESISVSPRKEKKVTTKANKAPLSSSEVLHRLAKKRDQGEMEYYYLKEVDGDSSRPYDLQVVQSSEAGPEHYLFTSDAVLHVTERGYGALVSLAEWHRESVLWKALQEIPFFRDFRLRRAFTRWNRNVRKICFQRKSKDLQDMLVLAVPQFRKALLVFTRIMEELSGTRRLPQEESNTFTLLELESVLMTRSQERLHMLEKFSRCRTAILNTVREDSYRAQHELQLHMEYAKRPNERYEPIHLHLAHQQQLKKQLLRAESILHKLGNFAALVNHMTVQSLVTVVRQDVLSFLSGVVKRGSSQQGCLFHTELCFRTRTQLDVDPPTHQFQGAVSEALLSAGDSLLQMCDSCGFFLEISSSDSAQDLTSDLSWTERPAAAGRKNNTDGPRSFCCCWLLRDPSAGWPALPERTAPMVQGNRVHGCYDALPRTQLEWQISINDVTKQAEEELAKMMQEAELEVQQLCGSYSWLLDVRLFIDQWSGSALESTKGQPASLYEEHIKTVRHWAETVRTVPSSVSTANQLFIIQCSCIKERLGQQLRLMEEEVLEQLVEQMKLLSESLLSDLDGAAAELRTEPRDLHHLSTYALMVRQSAEMLADVQKRLEYIHSLQDTICTNYRTMTEQEAALEEKLLAMWDCFVLLLKRADITVSHRLPPTVNALDTMFSFLARDLKNMASKATSGRFLDPTQNAKEMVSELNHMCVHVHSLSAKLDQLSRDSQNLHEHPMDLTVLTTDVQKVKARKELWELIAAYTTWMEEWKQLLFSEVVLSQAQERIVQWKERALSLTSIIPTHDAVLQETLGILVGLGHQVAVLAPLQSPALKHRHWEAIYQGVGLLYVQEKKVAVGELMSHLLEDDQELITKICSDAQAECNMEQTFQRLQQGWRTGLIQLDEFTLPVWQHGELQHGLTEKPTEDIVSNLQTACQHSGKDARFIIIGLDIHIADIESDVMTLSSMLASPHSAEFRLQIEDWIQSLQDLGKLLCLFERYQQVWAFLTKMFHETSFSGQRPDLLERFQPVDETFKKLLHSISTDPHVLNFVHSKKPNDRFHGKNLYQVLIDGLSAMETVSNQMVDLLETLCEQFPRLWFLSDREVMQLLSFHPTPFTLQPFVRRCFKGIRWLEVDSDIPSDTRGVKSDGASSQSHRQMKVLGFFGSFQEHIIFPSPLETNLNALVWLRLFEKQFKLTMVRHMKQCAIVRNQLEPSSQDLLCEKEAGENSKTGLPLLDLLSEYPLQCLLVAEEAVWCKAVLQASQESSPVTLSNLKAYNSANLKTLGRAIRDGVTGARSECLVSKYTMMCLRALVQLTMKHAQQLSRLMEVQCVLALSFEWLSVMKYHINSDWSLNDDPTCYVDVLGHRLQYDYEYFGPESCVMVHTPSTDRGTLGILLALTSYSCGLVSGPCMSGKNTTVVQLGNALGRQVVSVQCCPSMRPGVVQRMLLGALQTGAWLLLDSVDLLTQGVLSSLGQHLVDIHRSFSGLTRNQRENEPKDRTAFQMVLAGKSISARRSYGCVLISSKGYSSEVPESLRCATRPVALTSPDYRIITEVMLTSIGFSEAMSLSQRLVSLIGLAKDSLCLPDFITDHHSCYLVVLQKIISASEMHLEQSVRRRGVSDEVEQNVTGRVVEKDRKETEKASRFRSSYLSVIQGIMEETAIVKAILSVVLPVLHEQKKASQFSVLFKDTFPIVCQFPLFQQYIEEEEKIRLKDAVTEELQRKCFHSDTKLVSSALTLYQTMKFSQAVMLIGPSGSGKTTCYCALSGALNHLAAEAVEDVFQNIAEGDTSRAAPQISAVTWTSVDTVVLFPNAMSHEEVFGCFCENRGWRDGAVVKVLRDAERREPTICKKKQTQKWLVMDGNPAGQPGWLDHLTTLCCPEDPFLYLPSGETLPSRSHLTLLMEVTDLCDASPSAVTRCSLVYFTGPDLWKAVWNTEMDALSHKLDQGTMMMWNRLAEDLFSSTLGSLEQKALTPAVHNEGESLQSVTYGLQEITSFVRILRALLQHFWKDVEKAEAIPQIGKRDIPRYRTRTAGTDPLAERDLLARNLFLVAYIWGFSGHLHPRHWPEFDLLARQVLFACRYRIVVPDEKSVFEHFFNIDSRICSRNTLLTNPVPPQYEKQAYLLNLMLEANQPVLLAGEPASGKTTLCKTLLSSDKPHISLAASPLLSSRDLRTILSNTSCKKNRTKEPGLLLFVDDLHEAPCDVSGKTSPALETLRQSVSLGHILTFDAYHFKLLRAGTISYMATCCVFGSGHHHSAVVSPRLSRLFSIFVLPSLSMDVILSIHAPRLRIWLKEMPLKSSEDMACCIITATNNLYRAVCDQLQPSVQTPLFIFSHHDLQKVFMGMCLWQPNTGTMQKPGLPPVLDIAHLWMHECMRTFSDRLCSEEESKALASLIAKTAATHYGVRLIDETQPEPPTVLSPASHTLPVDTAGTCEPVGGQSLNLPQEPAGQADLKKGHRSSEPPLLSGNVSSAKILQHMEDIMTKLVYGPELSEVPSSYQDRDLDELLQELSELIERKEEGQEVDADDNMTTRFVVHRQRVSQLLRILRVLTTPGGHGVLIGSHRGTGRKTTVRLAAYVTGYRLMEVHPGNENKLHEILREAGNQSRVDGVNVIILVHEGTSPPVRDELLVAMAHRTYPGLYTDDELRDRVSRVTSVRKSRRYLTESWMFEKFLSQPHRRVHVFLLLPSAMTDSGPHGGNAQLTKALSSSCCVEVYQPWSDQSLVEVAAQRLKTSRCHKASLSVAMAAIHQSACRYASVLLMAPPFSPQTYMEFIAHFGFLCKHLHKQQQSQANRVASVLSHTDAMTNTAVQHKQHLMGLQEKLAETQQREEQLLRVLDRQRRLLEEAQDGCDEEGQRLHHLEEEVHHAHQQVRPVFLSGLKILNCLNPSDLEEVRHYRDPPDGVVRVMDAICLLFNRPPGWESAKQLLGRTNIFQELEFFDRYSVTDEQLQQLGHIVHSPRFLPESVLEASKACESLCRWVQAVYECCCMHHQLLAQQRAEAVAKEARGRLHLARQHEEDACRRHADVKLQLQQMLREVEEHQLELHGGERSQREAAAAAGRLETHVRGWRAAAQEAELSNQTLPGDALILAAAISYLGPFGPDKRTELLSKWRELCQTGSIDINPEDPRTSLFTHSAAAPSPPPLGFPLPVSERLQLPLGRALGTLQDAPSARLVVKLLLWGCRSPWVQLWPLLADTQQHLDKRSHSRLVTGEKAELEVETECGTVVCADDPDLLDQLDQAAEKGLRVLVTHVERVNPSPEFLSRLARSAGCGPPGLDQRVQTTHPDFCLLLSTQLPVQLLHSDIHPSVLAQVRVVDLSLSSDEIQELMLTQLLQSESRKLLIQRSRFQNDKQVLQERLISEEDALMDYILQSNTPLLQDPAFLPRVAVCQEAVRKLQAELQQLSEELDHYESLLAAPRQLMRLAAGFYQALQDVSRLSPAYFFSLRGFITAIQEAFTVRDRPLALCTVIPEVTNRMVAQLLVRYRPCLLQNHAAVLELLLSVALLQHNQLCSEAERAAFLRGLQDIRHPVPEGKPCSLPPIVSQSTSALPSWIPPHVLPELLCLDKIPVFRGLMASLSTCPRQWQEYLHFPSSTVAGAVPCRSHSHLSLLQRALLWKTVRPDCLEGLAEAMAAYHLRLPGQTAGTEAPHTGNPEALSRYVVQHEGPIILTLPSQRGETRTSIQPLHLINRLAHRVAGRKKVQVRVVSSGSLCVSVLNQAANEGHWLVFNDCHLLDQWDGEVTAHLSRFMSSSREERSRTHPSFRLWFINQEYASRSIPAAVRMWALPLVCDSPWDLKEELSSSLRQLLSVVRSQPPSAANMELLLHCAIFHSVLLQRQTCKSSGQGGLYSWSQDDLQALMDAHISVSGLCQDEAEALQRVAVSLVHGGHVLDSADLEVVDSVAKTCLSRASPLWGSGPHILSSVTSNPLRRDWTELLQMLERGLQDPAAISDPHVLGFSADVAAEMTQIKSHSLNLLLQASQTPPGAARSLSIRLNRPAALPAYRHARDRLQALQTHLTHLTSSTEAAPHTHLRDFLQAEWEELIDSVSSLLSRLRQPVQHGSPTFASLLQLADLSRLERRAELLSAYLRRHDIPDPPAAYRLSAFRNARGFLVALMREAARVHRKYISDISLHFEVLSDRTYPASLPLDAVYLCGLELRGASWDTQLGALQDSLQPSSLPLVCVRAGVRSTDTAPGSHVKDSHAAPQLPLYRCPLYLDGEALADAYIITTVPLHAKLHPVLCSLRRVRLVSML